MRARFRGCGDEAGKLRERLGEDDAGHDGIAGKMAGKKCLCFGEGFQPARRDAGLHRDEFIDEAKRRTVRQSA